MHLFFKAKLLRNLVAYAKSFSQHVSYTFHCGSICKTAYTGAAATEIGGDTTCREFQLMSKKAFASPRDLENYADLRMVIVDEVSFLDYDRDLSRLSEYLQMYTQEQSFPFGAAPIVFLGDF